MSHVRRIKAGIDWGSSSFRAYRFQELDVIDSIENNLGIKSAPATGRSEHFATQLWSLIGDWLTPGDHLLLSGMITSVNGWQETSYLDCPVNCDRITANLHTLTNDGLTLHFVPGICQKTPFPDVMRGEELQLLGLADTHNRQLVVMPGTHSKWAAMEQQSLRQFRTIMTGELFNTLLNHTLVGKLATSDSWCEDTYTRAVIQGYESKTIVADLFQCRSSVLLNKRNADQVSAYLSGILIGHEIREGTTMYRGQCDSVILVGSDRLCDKYLSAMESLNLTVQKATPYGQYPDISAAGFGNLIQQMSL